MKICNIITMIETQLDFILTKLEEAFLLLNHKLL